MSQFCQTHTARTRIHTRTHAHTHTRTRAHAHTRTRAHARTHAHTRTVQFVNHFCVFVLSPTHARIPRLLGFIRHVVRILNCMRYALWFSAYYLIASINREVTAPVTPSNPPGICICCRCKRQGGLIPH